MYKAHTVRIPAPFDPSVLGTLQSFCSCGGHMIAEKVDCSSLWAGYDKGCIVFFFHGVPSNFNEAKAYKECAELTELVRRIA